MKKIIITTVFAGMVICVCLLMYTCKQTSQPEEIDETGLVIPGVGMDGVKLGDSQETVLAKLGKPTSFGFADGPYRSWRVYDYNEGRHAGLSVYFMFVADGEYGSVDMIQTQNLYDGRPYSGRTREGIGLGSAIKDVHNAFGLPDTSTKQISNQIWELYCIGKKHTHLAYKDSVIFAIEIGFYEPMPKDPWTSKCK